MECLPSKSGKLYLARENKKCMSVSLKICDLHSLLSRLLPGITSECSFQSSCSHLKKKSLHSFQSSGHFLVHYKTKTLALQNNRESLQFSANTGTNSYISMPVFCLLTYYRGRGIWPPSKGNFLLIPEISICSYLTLKQWRFIFISFLFPKKDTKLYSFLTTKRGVWN